ncbi:hypothetical protein KB553_11490 [Chryseobacterium rhizoplanae]|uniref:hypothetical protein n=1 Tax=Chryseobacterium rhizoplanae TaxID=1609531 RepID=UPI001CE375CD|nr:hypothetical protein [Chryseobacterium rhizoplanae]UCA62115.1 hypothetical protein KB553_11490 [Chryseobacterium rhizoplanae]
MPSNNEKKGAIRFPDCSKYVMVATDYNTKIVKIMLDNLKFSITDQEIIGRLLCFAESEMLSRKPQNNNYVCYSKFGALMRFDFRKSIENGYLIGFRHLEVSISPHYHFNGYLHNGNDFSPKNCLKTLRNIFMLIKLRQEEFDLLKVVNIEYGLNLVPNIKIKNLIDGICFHKRTSFMVPDVARPYFKITEATKYKQIKAYAKGLQFMDYPEYDIDLNTFRFEVKSKQSKCISKMGVTTVKDLFNEDVYNMLFQSLLDEWENILFTYEKEKFDVFLNDSNRDKFNYERRKYMKNNAEVRMICRQIKGQLIDKFLSFQNSANSTQKIPMNTGKVKIRDDPSPLINLEYAEFNINTTKNRGLKLGTSSI